MTRQSKTAGHRPDRLAAVSPPTRRKVAKARERTQRPVSFRISKIDRQFVDRILDRVANGCALRGQDAYTPDERRTLAMDLTAVHANGCRMDFLRLLGADDFNFAHDVNGIQRHIDRTTGTLKDCFVPRFASRKPRNRQERNLARLAPNVFSQGAPRAGGGV